MTTHSFLTAPAPNKANLQRRIWLSLSLGCAALYGVLALKQAFAGEYIVQDDARQHVFWMLRFLDPELFPNDLIADYFQSVAPAGYTVLYRLAAAVGLDPFLFNKLLPLILVLITSAYCFGVCLQILPVPLAGFIATLLLNQNLWVRADIASGTPRAFAAPLLLAFLYYLSRRRLLPCLVAITLTGLFYPQCIFLIAGMLIFPLFKWQPGRLKLAGNLPTYRFCLSGLIVAVGVLLPYALTTSEFDPVVALEQARQMPEFAPNGRTAFFDSSFEEFWIDGERSGAIPQSLLTPATLAVGLLLPILAPLHSFFPLARQLTPGVWLLAQLLIVSIGMFFTAHAVLFRLHLPSRYTLHSLPIIIALAAGISLTLILDTLLNWAARSELNKGATALFAQVKKLVALSLGTLIGGTLVLYPYFIEKFPIAKYKTGDSPALYQFLAAQPPDILIASLSEEVNFIPSFSQRSILVGREYAIPYHLGYYNQFRQRASDLITAQYSREPEIIREFIQKYQIDFWLLDRSAFSVEYLTNNPWLQQYQSATQKAIGILDSTQAPLLLQLLPTCTVFSTEAVVVLDTECMLKALPK